MKIKKIILKNIRSYNEQEIEFPEGSTLLSGDIGSGKTSILLGIEFALFGLQPGQRGSALLKNGEKEGGVIIEFEIDDQEIIIERTLKKSKTISQDYCAITLDGKKREISVTELKNKVLELLNYPKEFSKKQNLLYKFTVYTPQEEMKQIILQDAETRINTLRHVFGIDKYKKILENLSTIALKIREEKRIKEGMTFNLEQDKSNLISKKVDLESLNCNLDSIEKELFLKREKRKKTEEEKQEISKKIEEKNKFSQEIEKTKIIIENKKTTILDNEKSIEQLKDQIIGLSDVKYDFDEVHNLEKEILAYKKEKVGLEEKKLNINSEITSINSKKEGNLKLENKISNLEICPTCLQKVEAVYRANILNKLHNDLSSDKNRLEELEIQKKEISEQITKIDFEIHSKERKITDLRILKIKLEGIKEKQTRIREIENSNSSAKKDIELLMEHVENLKSLVLDMTKFEKVYAEKQKELENDLRLERIAEIKVAELKREIVLFSSQIDELTIKIKKVEEIQEKMIYLSELEDWISKKFSPLISLIEKNVMIKLKAEFSQLFANWFGILVSDTFNVNLDDDFTPIIEQQDYEIDYAYLSGGERTAIALAYRLSLNQVINSLMSKIKTRDVVILDEPTDGFSEQQLDKMRDVLQQLNVRQLIIVSHEQKIEEFVENVIRFKKENGISVKVGNLDH